MAEVSLPYVLCRVEDDGTTTPVSEHGDIVEGIQAGKQMVEQQDFDFAYSLHSNGCKVATFGAGRIGYREWARRSGRLDYISSQDDKLDKEVDELLRVHYSGSQ